jgi:hypothetical protein
MSAAVKTRANHRDYCRANMAMLYLVVLTVRYTLSRGIAKSGSEPYDDDRDEANQRVGMTTINAIMPMAASSVREVSWRDLKVSSTVEGWPVLMTEV